jgi:hypothetical protein
MCNRVHHCLTCHSAVSTMWDMLSQLKRCTNKNVLPKGMVIAGAWSYTPQRFLEYLNSDLLSSNFLRGLGVLAEINDASRLNLPKSRVEELLEEFNRRMQRYTASPHLQLQAGRVVRGWRSKLSRGTSLVDYTVLAPGVFAAIEHHHLEKLARCAWGGNWFFRRVEGQRFCSARCREKAFKSTEEFKAERRAKRRALYRTRKILERGKK